MPIPAVYSETSLTRDGGDRYWDPRSRASNEPSNLQGIKILAVDDSSDTRELLSLVLENCGATVITASSAREALDVFAGWKPNLIVCDIGMPELDGCAFVKTIRQLPREQGGDTPAIALTGYARVEDRERIFEAGYQLFVPKPIEAAKLCSIIANVVSDNAYS